MAFDDQIVACAELPESARPTALLLPAIARLCGSVGWSPREIELICVDEGPGSYTGLRVGLTCAKTLAFATGAALATAESPAVLAAGAPPGELALDVALDAARGQVFAARFERRGARMECTVPVHIEDADAWLASLSAARLVIGPALEKYRSRIAPPLRVADASQCWPRAGAVIEIGLQHHQTAPRAEYFSLEPLYLRPSAAEEKRGASPRAEFKN